MISRLRRSSLPKKSKKFSQYKEIAGGYHFTDILIFQSLIVHGFIESGICAPQIRDMSCLIYLFLEEEHIMNFLDTSVMTVLARSEFTLRLEVLPD